MSVLHYHAETELGQGDHRTGAIHDFANRGVLVADDHGVSDHRPKPMKEVEHFGPAYPGKQVFIASGESYNFVGKNRAGDDDLIVIKKPAIDVDGHVHRKKAAT